jgi:formylglycine-generating enzyme required for sulfatase activity
MHHIIWNKANVLRSLFFLFIPGALAACAQAAPFVPSPPPTARVVSVVATNAPVTPTTVALPTAAATQQASPTRTEPPTATHAPSPTDTRTPTPVPPTATKILATATHTPTKIPPTAIPTNQPTNAPTSQPPSQPFAPTELITIPEGVLPMGGKADADDPDEKPFHDVTMYEYRIDKDEVTNAQYQACVAAKACPPPTKNSSYTRPSYFGNSEFANYPVVNVTWNDANAYCAWIGRRLPNEAEWERAAKGVENWRYTWSNSIGMHFEWNAIFHGSPISFCEASCPLQNYWTDVNDGFPETAPVGQFSEYDNSSGFGVIDMAGNVAEWTNNWYDGNAYSDGNDVYGPNEPTGEKVVRGGSWADEPRRNSDREPQAPDYSSDRIGFRCAQ